MARPCATGIATALLALTLSAIAGAAAETWSEPRGLYGGRITSLAIDPVNPAILYAATPEAGVFKTVDGARSWRPVNTGLEVLNLKTLAVDPSRPQTVYLGYEREWLPSEGGVFKTTNGGRTWHAVARAFGETKSVSALAVDPRNTNVVYAGTTSDLETEEGGARIYKSRDAGETWRRVWTGEDLNTVEALVIDLRTSSTVYAATWDGVFKTTNGGRRWRPANVGFGEQNVNALAVDPRTPATLYAGLSSRIDDGIPGGVWKSVNGGRSWTRMSVGLGVHDVTALTIDPLRPSALYAISGDRVFRSVDGARRWQRAGRGLPADAAALAVDPRQPAIVYAGTNDWSGFLEGRGGGVYKSRDRGRRFRAANEGLASMNLDTLVAHPRRAGTLYAGTFGDGLYASDNGGRFWRAEGVGDSVSAVGVSASRPSTLYVAGYYDPPKRSDDAGRSWREASEGLLDRNHNEIEISELVVDPRAHTTVYAGTADGVYKTTNGGLRWRRSTVGVGRRYVQELVVHPRRRSLLYAVSSRAGIFASTNAARSWRSVNDGLPGRSVSALAVDPRSPRTLYAGLSARQEPRRMDGGVYKSVDQGTTWRAVNADLPQGGRFVSDIAVDPRSSIVYAIVNGDVYRSRDGAASWSRFTSGLVPGEMQELAIAPAGRLYAGSSNGLIFELSG